MRCEGGASLAFLPAGNSAQQAFPLSPPGCAPGPVLSEAPYAELPEQGLTFVPLYYAGTLFGRATGS